MDYLPTRHPESKFYRIVAVFFALSRRTNALRRYSVAANYIVISGRLISRSVLMYFNVNK
jgi:hypothetical protein